MFIQQTSRRSFLMVGGAALVLPILESFAKEAQPAKPSKRMVFCGTGYGFEEASFYPTKAGIMKELTPGMSSLERHKNDITFITNLSNTGASEPHSGSTSYLTGANVRGTPGKRFHNSISCDLVAGNHLGRDMRYSSLVLDGKGSEPSGHGPGLSLAWTKDGKPVSGIKGPAQLYARLFGQANETLEELHSRLTRKKSILDIMRSDIKGLNSQVSSIDRDKLDEYFQSLRQIELSLAKEKQWASQPKPKIEMQAPDESIAGEAEIRVTYDLIALALQTNQTPVVSYRQPMWSFVKGMGINSDPHALSHYHGSAARTSSLQEVDQRATANLAYFIDVLKKTMDVDGSSLFDNIILSWGTNIRTGHMIKNVPAIITGGGAKQIRHGRNVILPEKDTPLSNLWLTLLQQAGVPSQTFGSSTGTLPEILS